MSDEIKDVDVKWTERFARLEVKTFAVPVEPVKRPPSVLTSDQHFFILERPPLACPLV